jgi:hypothetical protein
MGASFSDGRQKSYMVFRLEWHLFLQTWPLDSCREFRPGSLCCWQKKTKRKFVSISPKMSTECLAFHYLHGNDADLKPKSIHVRRAA